MNCVMYASTIDTLTDTIRTYCLKSFNDALAAKYKNSSTLFFDASTSG